MIAKTFFIVASLVCLGVAFYTEEPVEKFFTVRSYSTRYPASDSVYRLFIEKGFVSSD